MGSRIIRFFWPGAACGFSSGGWLYRPNGLLVEGAAAVLEVAGGAAAVGGRSRPPRRPQPPSASSSAAAHTKASLAATESYLPVTPDPQIPTQFTEALPLWRGFDPPTNP